MTAAAKALVWDAFWQPFGSSYVINGTATLDARLPGQWFQAETGLHDNWHRQYDPALGRYTQPDPLGFVDGPSLYAYVQGIPQSKVDRDGRQTAPPALDPFVPNVDPNSPKCFSTCRTHYLLRCVPLTSAPFCAACSAWGGPYAGLCAVGATAFMANRCISGANQQCAKVCDLRPGL
jgi:RHS repeat-associated protein